MEHEYDQGDYDRAIKFANELVAMEIDWSHASPVLMDRGNAFRAKGDNGKWQLNYSSLIGNLATTGISALYQPPAIRNNSVETLKYSVLSVASQGVSALLQEFVFKRMTSHANEPGKGGSSDSTLRASPVEPAPGTAGSRW